MTTKELCQWLMDKPMSDRMLNMTAHAFTLEFENKRLRDCITALMPFLMEDYEGGVMTAEYKAAIELAIAATGTEARHAS
jgi:hypothetical protein